ncbi:MAG: hypothetical protein H7Z11_15675 [Verrucomicrobia bacterium]|nr:hypothetical protein [Leptolyngbya sp. ES-bin-22]
MMNVVVLSPQAVQIDGSNYGNVADAIANNPALAAAIQTALNGWFIDLTTEHQAALEVLQKQISGEAALKAEKEALQGQVLALQAELDGRTNPVEPEQRWDVFRSLMMTDPDYQTMLMTVMAPVFGGHGNWIATTMQQAISMPQPSLQLVQPLWNQIVNLAMPPAAAVERWQSYVEQSHVPIVFSADGHLDR